MDFLRIARSRSRSLISVSILSRKKLHRNITNGKILQIFQWFWKVKWLCKAEKATGEEYRARNLHVPNRAPGFTRRWDSELPCAIRPDAG